MNRLERELRARGIIYEADDFEVMMHGVEHDVDAKLVSVENGVITILQESAVMDPMFKLYDLHFNPIGGQDVYPIEGFGRERCLEWGSWSEEYHEKNGVNYLDRFGKYQMVYFYETDEYYLVDMDAMTVIASGEHDEVWSLLINIVDKITRRCVSC